MSVARNLNVNLSVITSKFEKGFKDAGKFVKEFASHIKEAATKIAEFGIASGLAAVAGLAVLVHHQIEEIDANSKLANQLRTTMEGLAGLQLAAKLSGLEAEQLNKGLNHLTKSLGGLAGENKEMVAAFGKLGLAQKDLAGLPTDKAMLKIADAFQKGGNSARNTTAIMEIFGAKIGANFVNLLSDGSAGLNKQTEEAKRLGLAVNEVDAAQVEAAQEAMIKAGEAAKGLGNRLAVELSPYITAAADAFTDFRAKGNATLSVVGVIDAIKEHTEALSNVVDVVKVVWNALWLAADVAAQSMVAALKAVLQGLDWILKMLGRATTGTAEFMSEWLKGIQSNVHKDWMGLSTVGDSEAKIKTALDAVRAKAVQIKEDAKKHGDELTKNREKLKALGTQMEAIAVAKEKHDKESADLQKKLAELTKKNATPQEKFNEGIKKLNEMITKAKELKIEIKQSDIDRERQRLAEELEKEIKPKIKMKDNMEVGAVKKFSAEALSAIQKTGRGDAAAQLLAEQVEHKKLLAQMAKDTATIANKKEAEAAFANL